MLNILDLPSISTIDDINEIKKDVEKKSYFDLVHEREECVEIINTFQNCHNEILKIKKIELDEPNQKIRIANILDDYEVSMTIDEFEEGYPKAINYYHQLLSIIADAIIEKSNITKTSEINQEFIKLIDSFCQENPYSEKLEIQKNAFLNRNDLSFLKSDMEKYFSKSKLNILKSFFRNIKKINKQKNTLIMKSFTERFSSEIISVVEPLIFEICNNNRNVEFLFIKELTRILENEKESGHSVWVKILIFNLLDIKDNKYDLDENSGKSYIEELTNLVGKYIVAFAKDNHIY